MRTGFFLYASFKKEEFILSRLIDNFKETSTSLLPMVDVVILIQLKLQPVAWLTILRFVIGVAFY